MSEDEGEQQEDALLADVDAIARAAEEARLAELHRMMAEPPVWREDYERSKRAELHHKLNELRAAAMFLRDEVADHIDVMSRECDKNSCLREVMDRLTEALNKSQ